jgi:hypothetical protein
MLCFTAVLLYNFKLSKKSSSRVLLSHCSPTAMTISGNCFVNLSGNIQMNKSLVLAAVIAAAALAACGKKEEAVAPVAPAPMAAPAPAAAPAPEATASAAAPVADDAAKKAAEAATGAEKK